MRMSTSHWQSRLLRHIARLALLGGIVVAHTGLSAAYAAVYSDEAWLNANNGYEASRGLTRGTDGLLYGAAQWGGEFGAGTVFRRDERGRVTAVHSFTDKEGHSPVRPAPLTPMPDGTLWGVHSGGGVAGQGTVFKFDPTTGVLTVLHSFGGLLGSGPTGRLLLASDGYVYGTTLGGGMHDAGTIFRIDPATGTIATLHAFTLSGGEIGGYPFAGLTEGEGGQLYGVTSASPTSDTTGAVFRLDPVSGHVHLVHAFSEAETGARDELVASGGALYGVARGAFGSNSGLVFSVRPNGHFEVLHSFEDGFGSYPSGPLVLASDGFLYGQTFMKAKDGWGMQHGTAYRLRPNGGRFLVLSVYPTRYAYGELVELDGALWGVTSRFPKPHGTIFKLTPASLPRAR